MDYEDLRALNGKRISFHYMDHAADPARAADGGVGEVMMLDRRHVRIAVSVFAPAEGWTRQTLTIPIDDMVSAEAV